MPALDKLLTGEPYHVDMLENFESLEMLDLGAMGLDISSDSSGFYTGDI